VLFDKESTPPGADFLARIQEAIDRADAMIFLISQPSLQEDSFTLAELEMAQCKWPNARRKVFPVMVNPTRIAELNHLERIPA